MTIKDWLNSDRNFTVGVALYDTYGTDDLLKKMFAQGFSDIRAKRLFDELLLLKSVTENIIIPNEEPQSAPVLVASFAMPEQIVDAEKDPYREKWLPLYQHMNLLRHSLEITTDETQRGKIAHQILDLEQQCMCIWSQRDYYLKTGRELQPESNTAEPVTDYNQLTKRLQLLRSYIAKYKRSNNTEKIEQFEQEKKSILQQLNPEA